MNKLIPIQSITDIPHDYQNTPIGLLFEYHNFNRPHDKYDKAQLLVGMCMDNRKQLKVPEIFSFILRTGGANLRYSEFKVSFAVSVGGVKHIALIGHNHCGMVNLKSKKEDYINGLVTNAGWTRQQAEEHFNHYAPMFEIGNEVDFILSETKRLRKKYPQIVIAPIIYKVDDNKLYLIQEA